MKTPLFVVGILLAAATSSQAFAATVHNSSAMPQTISVVENGKTSEMLLAASATKADICPQGCDLLHGVHKLSLDGSETVNIEHGKLVIDETDVDDKPE